MVIIVELLHSIGALMAILSTSGCAFPASGQDGAAQSTLI